MALISSKQIDFSGGLSGSINVTGSLNLQSPGSASFNYVSSSGAVIGSTGSFDYISITGELSVDDITADTGSFGSLNLTGDISVDDITIGGDLNTALTASSFTYIDSNQKLNTVTPIDGQLLMYTASAFIATNIIDGGSY